MINQVQGSALDGGIGRLYLRLRAPEPMVAEAVGPGAEVGFGAGDRRNNAANTTMTRRDASGERPDEFSTGLSLRETQRSCRRRSGVARSGVQ